MTPVYLTHGWQPDVEPVTEQEPRRRRRPSFLRGWLAAPAALLVGALLGYLLRGALS